MAEDTTLQFGVNPSGFLPKRLADIVADMRRDLAAIVDPATGQTPFVNVSDDSVLGQLVGIVAERAAECWSAANDAYYQFDPLFNTGMGQSGTVQINGILRRAATTTVLSVTLRGATTNTGPVVVPDGAIVTTLDQLTSFVMSGPVTIPPPALAPGGVTMLPGTAMATATATVKGAVTVTPGTGMLISTPQTPGWDSVVCTGTVIQGAAEETDSALRLRQQVSTASTAYRHVEAIAAAVGNVPGVTFRKVYQNRQASGMDSQGLPPKTVAVVALGGDEQAIAEAIFLRVPIGMDYYGGPDPLSSVTRVVTDMQGIEYPITFSRPSPVQIRVAVTIAAIDGTFPSETYNDDIISAILNYAQNGPPGFGIPEGFDRSGFLPGDNVYASLLFTAVNSIPGQAIQSVQVSGYDTTANEWTPYADSVPIGWNQLASFGTTDNNNITVTLTNPT